MQIVPCTFHHLLQRCRNIISKYCLIFRTVLSGGRKRKYDHHEPRGQRLRVPGAILAKRLCVRTRLRLRLQHCACATSATGDSDCRVYALKRDGSSHVDLADRAVDVDLVISVITLDGGRSWVRWYIREESADGQHRGWRRGSIGLDGREVFHVSHGGLVTGDRPGSLGVGRQGNEVFRYRHRGLSEA
jgi:hypothetical protein